MFQKRKSDELLEAEIERTLDDMGTYTQDEEDYATRLSNLERLDTLRPDKPQKVSRDTLAVVAGNLLTILIIVAYEQKHVIQTRGLPFLLKTTRKS